MYLIRKAGLVFLTFSVFWTQAATVTLKQTEKNRKSAAKTPVREPGLKAVAENKPSLSKKAKKRLPQSTASFPCIDYFKTKYERGHVERQFVSCSNEDYNSGICLSQSEVLRNYCKSNQLIRYYCDSREQEGFSAESVPCEKGCPPHSGKCSR